MTGRSYLRSSHMAPLPGAAGAGGWAGVLKAPKPELPPWLANPPKAPCCCPCCAKPPKPPELAPKPGEDCCAKAAKPPAPPKPLLKAAALEAAGVAGCPKPAPKLLGWPNPGVAACMNAGCAKLVEVAAGCPKPPKPEEGC